MQCTTPNQAMNESFGHGNEVKHARLRNHSSCVIDARAHLMSPAAGRIKSAQTAPTAIAFTLCVIELWHRCKKTYQTSRNGCRPEAADASGADARGPAQQHRLVFPSHAPPRQDHAVRLPRLPRNSQLYRLPGTQISPKSTTVKELGDSQQNKDS